MSVINNQSLFSVGSRLHIAKYDQSTGNLREWRDIGTLGEQGATPDVKATAVEATDARSGLIMVIDKRVVRYDETYDIETTNMSMENLIYLYGDNVPRSYSQAAATVTVACPFFQIDSIIPLIDSNTTMEKVYNIASISSVTAEPGAVAATAGTDYIATPEMLALGLIYIPPTSTISGSSTTLNIAYVANAISASLREILPWTSSQMKVQFRAVYMQPALSFVMVREGTGYVTPSKPKFDAKDYCSVAMQIQVIGNSVTTASGAQAGRLLLPIGTLPTVA